MDPPELDPWADIPLSSVASDAHSAVARQVVAESVVLLSNNNGALPIRLNGTLSRTSSRTLQASHQNLKAETKNQKFVRTIAVIGPSADDVSVQAHTYHGTPSKWVTVLDAIKTAASASHVNVTAAVGCSRTSADKSGFVAAIALAAAADAVVFVGGLQASMEEVR